MNSPKVSAAICKVIAKLNAMPDTELAKEFAAHQNGDIYAALMRIGEDSIDM